MMAGIVTSEHRSWLMAQVRDRDTAPELLVRSLLHRLGYRFRLHRRDLPGNPDLVFPARRAVIFVNGCFWHGHNCARGARVPVANRDYWLAKIDGNRRRDRRNRQRLRTLGWRSLTIWECATRDRAKLIKRMLRFLGPASGSGTPDP